MEDIFLQREIKAGQYQQIQSMQIDLQSHYLQILNMSYIIDQLDNFLSARKNTFNFEPPVHNPSSSKTNSQIPIQKDEIIKSLGRFSSSVIDTQLNHTHLTLSLLLNNVFRNISIILKVKLNCITSSVSFVLRLLGPDNKPLCIVGRQRRLLFCKVLVSRFYLTAFREFKITVSMLNGEIQLLSALYNLSCDSYSSLSALIVHIAKLFSKNLDFLYEPVNFTKQVCSSSYNMPLQPLRKEADERIKKLYNYSTFSSVSINLTLDSNSDDETSINRKHQKELESVQRLKSTYVSLKNPNGLDLYALSDFNQLRNQVSNFDISFLQREQIAQKTAPPCMPKSKDVYQNNYILNYIRINRKNNIRKLHVSNFTSITLAEMEYSYVGSYCVNSQNKKSNDNSLPTLKKYIVVKREEPNIRRSRIAHQKTILTKIKDGMSMFLPKYYINIDKNPQDEYELMADYLNYPTLADYVSKNLETVSYQTKIYLGYTIAQGLRYLQEYQIAHLDLKPSNIMFSKKMMLKFIDFGESYHPDLKNHQPGFSVPYSAPENYKFPQHYTHKNDVFSLGIILYELFLSKYPFNFFDQQKRAAAYRKDNVYNYWFCSPEENLNYGEGTIFPILQLLIGKCLSPNPDERPELQWAVLILRNCLDYLY